MPNMMDAAAALFDDFHIFIQQHPQPQDGDLLQDFILEWLENGDAVVESGGDFGTISAG